MQPSDFDPWKEVLTELVIKLSAPLAFAVLVLLLTAWFGEAVPADFKTLVYVVVIGGMLVYAIPQVLKSLGEYRQRTEQSNLPLAGAQAAPPVEPPAVSAQAGTAAQVGDIEGQSGGAVNTAGHDVIRDQTIVHAHMVYMGAEPAEKPSAVEQKPAGQPAPLDPPAARRCYLEALIQDCSPLRLVGLDPKAADPGRGGLSLENVYVSLDTTTPRRLPAEDEKPGRRPDRQPEINAMRLAEEEKRPLAALEILTRPGERRAVLLGLPGTGKSTFVRYLALRMGRALYEGAHLLPELLADWPGKPLLPVIIPLGRMAESLPPEVQRGEAGHVETFLAQMLQDDARMACFADHILPALKEEGGLLLFDGLDEVANLARRRVVIEAVQAFAKRYEMNPASRFLVTCRTYSYYHDRSWQLTGWPTHELALLDPPKIAGFIQAWYDEHAHIEPARQESYARKCQNLLRAVQIGDRRRLAEIAAFPIILTMMAVVHTHYGELPDTRAQVYERCTDLLLVHWDVERPVLPGKRQRQSLLDALGVQRGQLDMALREVAFKAHKGWAENGPAGGAGKEKVSGPALVTEDLLAGVMQVYLQDQGRVQTFLEYCQSANGLLMLQGTVRDPQAPPEAALRRYYAFPHQTFQEYLAGRSLDGANVGARVRDLLLSSDRWREVVIFLGEYLCFERQDAERLDSILQALTSYPSPAAPGTAPTSIEQGRLLWLAGDLLLIYRRMFVAHPSPWGEAVLTGLRRAVETAPFAPPERAAAADLLDELGWQPPDLFHFVPIPPEDGGRQTTDHRRSPSAAGDFFIARYLVTNAQYARFLQAEDFGDPPLWLDLPRFDEHSLPMKENCGQAGWEWYQNPVDPYSRETRQRAASGAILPRLWQDTRFGANRPGAPVVGVSWYEANAYCRWLLRHWAELEEGRANPDLRPRVVRLPAEAEWVRAAGGAETPERFPWDEAGQATKDLAEITRRANVEESKIGRTTPVGAFQPGASYPYGLQDLAGNAWEWQANFYGQDHKGLALRGGGWSDHEGYARLDARYVDLPDAQWHLAGCRVLALPD